MDAVIIWLKKRYLFKNNNIPQLINKVRASMVKFAA
jgi:hypothetical protein